MLSSSIMNPIPVSMVPRIPRMENWTLGSGLRNPMSLLDVFDPFDKLDQALNRQLAWLDRPESMLKQRTQPEVPHRYRITLDCAGFRPQTIKTELKEMKGRAVLRILGLDERGSRGTENYTKKELRRCFTLPRNVEHDKMVSFMTPSGQLVVEFPLLRKRDEDMPEKRSRSTKAALLPKIVETRGGKEVRVRFPLPEGVDLDKVHLSLKDRDLIMRVEDKTVTDGTMTRIHLYDQCTLPDNTDWSSLKCLREKEHLTVCAPLVWDVSRPKSHDIPIDDVYRRTRKQITEGRESSISQEPMVHKKSSIGKKTRERKSISPEKKKQTISLEHTRKSVSPMRTRKLSPTVHKKKDILPEKKKSLSPKRKKKEKVLPIVSKKKDISPERKKKSKSVSPVRKDKSKERKKDVSPTRKRREVSPLIHMTPTISEISKKKKKKETVHDLPTSNIFKDIGKKKNIVEEDVKPLITRKKSKSLPIDLESSIHHLPTEQTFKKKKERWRNRTASPDEPMMREIPVQTSIGKKKKEKKEMSPERRRTLSPKKGKFQQRRSASPI